MVVALTAVGTFLLRLSLVAVLARFSIPAGLQRGLRLVGPAALAALVAQGLLLSGAQLRPLGSWHVAAAVAVLTAAATRSMGLTLAVGMAAVWSLSALF